MAHTPRSLRRWPVHRVFNSRIWRESREGRTRLKYTALQRLQNVKVRFFFRFFFNPELKMLHRLANFSNADINVYRLAEGEPVPGLPSDPTPSTPPKTKPKAVETSDIIHIDDTDIDSPTLSDASPPARAPGSKKRIKQAPVVTTYAGQRKSKRIRTAAAVKRGTTFSVNISKDDTIRDIKEKVCIRSFFG